MDSRLDTVRRVTLPDLTLPATLSAARYWRFTTKYGYIGSEFTSRPFLSFISCPIRI